MTEQYKPLGLLCQTFYFFMLWNTAEISILTLMTEKSSNIIDSCHTAIVFRVFFCFTYRWNSYILHLMYACNVFAKITAFVLKKIKNEQQRSNEQKYNYIGRMMPNTITELFIKLLTKHQPFQQNNRKTEKNNVNSNEFRMEF